MPRLSVVSYAFGLAVAGLVASSLTGLTARQNANDAVRVDADDLAGVVTSTRGPEAGVWVVADTRDQPTPMRKIVVTDDRGRYLLPDLPKGNY